MMETYNGHVRSPADAIVLFEACRLGLLPRVQRRLSEKERQSIRSGSVFVWDEREAGMRRWTDGKSWSASRVSGSFLTYREMEGKRGGSGFAPPAAARGGKTPESGRNSADDREGDGEEGPDGYRYKPDGLMKQSFSITTSTGQHLHLISYYARSHPNAPGLQQPSTDASLRSIRPAKGMYPESTINDQSTMPAVTRSPMAGAPGYAMSPQNPPYGRPGATHPQGYAPQGYPPSPYNFPPSPLATPPHAYPVQHPYGPGSGPLPPMSANGHYPGPHYAPSPQMPVSQPPPTAYDQRPLRTPESHHPPPPPPPQYAAPPAGGPYMHTQSPHFTHPPPPPPPPALERPSPAQQATAALILDPRLMGAPTPSPAPQSNGQNAPKTEDTTPEAKPRENGASPTSAASQTPSIGALVHGPPAAEADATTKTEANGENQGSTSPGGTQQSSAPQDIPSEKLGFKEDKRALRQLDKVFTA